MQRAEIIAPVGREKKGRGRQVRTKSFHSLRHTFVSRLANAYVSAELAYDHTDHIPIFIQQRAARILAGAIETS